MRIVLLFFVRNCFEFVRMPKKGTVSVIFD